MIPINILPQPTDETCGPTCLHAIYSYYGESISLKEVIAGVSYVEYGGTLAVLLAIHALKRGYTAKIYTYNLRMFDPTWLLNTEINIQEKLHEQLKYKRSIRRQHATEAYIEFLNLGGKLVFEDLTPTLLGKYFNKNIPILAGLSATYLYQSCRETISSVTKEIIFDDVKGYPTGHFVVLGGYDNNKTHIIVADPYQENPFSTNNYYSVKVQRVINSIMLGILTYDANFLIIEPK
ncbi:C39 family peptidase [soil metagenome]